MTRVEGGFGAVNYVDTSMPKPKKTGARRIYACSRKDHVEMCKIEVPDKAICRPGCEYLRDVGTLKDRLDFEKKSRRLVNFERTYYEIQTKWGDKHEDFLKRELHNDAYIIGKICEILAGDDLRIAQAQLTAQVMAVKLPLFRNYYKMAREDVRILRKIQKDHDLVAIAKERVESGRMV